MAMTARQSGMICEGYSSTDTSYRCDKWSDSGHQKDRRTVTNDATALYHVLVMEGFDRHYYRFLARERTKQSHPSNSSSLKHCHLQLPKLINRRNLCSNLLQ
jgi:hypothetical protein